MSTSITESNFRIGKKVKINPESRFAYQAVSSKYGTIVPYNQEEDLLIFGHRAEVWARVNWFTVNDVLLRSNIYRIRGSFFDLLSFDEGQLELVF